MIKITVKLFIITLNYHRENILIHFARFEVGCSTSFFSISIIILTKINCEHRCEFIFTITNNIMYVIRSSNRTTKIYRFVKIFLRFCSIFAFNEKKFFLDYIIIRVMRGHVYIL